MATLVVEPIGEAIDQAFQEITPTNNTFVEAIRLNLYKHNAPAGTVAVQVQDTNGKVIATSNSVTITDISVVAFFHGLVRFDVSASLKASVTYRMAVSTSGYTFADASYLGWVKDSHGRRIYDLGYSAGGSFDSALHLEIWERKNLIRGS